ncbi:hypothetical protein D3C78_1454240 [compost metagenome]
MVDVTAIHLGHVQRDQRGARHFGHVSHHHHCALDLEFHDLFLAIELDVIGIVVIPAQRRALAVDKEDLLLLGQDFAKIQAHLARAGADAAGQDHDGASRDYCTKRAADTESAPGVCWDPSDNWRHHETTP